MDVSEDECGARLRTLFDATDSANAPIILLVHHVPSTLNILQHFGIETKEWKDGVGVLLGYGVEEEMLVKEEPKYSRSSSREYSYKREYSESRDRKYSDYRRSRSPKRVKREYDGYSDRDYGYSKRSRSPKRENSRNDYPRHSYQRSSSPSNSSSRASRPLFDSPPCSPEPPSLPPVLILSTSTLYTTLTMTWDSRPSLHDVCRRLNIDTHGMDMAKEWCAGNEAQ